MSIATLADRDRAHAAGESQTLVAVRPHRTAPALVAQATCDVPLARSENVASNETTAPDVTAQVVRWAPLAVPLFGAAIAFGIYLIYWAVLLPR